MMMIMMMMTMIMMMMMMLMLNLKHLSVLFLSTTQLFQLLLLPLSEQASLEKNLKKKVQSQHATKLKFKFKATF